jgi:hypothetical protein
MTVPPKAGDFRQVLNAKFERCTQAGQDYVDVHAGDLHRQVGNYPGPNHRLAVCCFVMKKEMSHGDEILQTTPSGKGANVVVRYRIPRPVIVGHTEPASPNTGVTNKFNTVLDKIDVINNIKIYMKSRAHNKRYASFDYCFNYFHEFYDRDNIKEIAAPENIQQSSLQLGFFLASWGMFRGKSFLLQKSAKHFESLITAISKLNKKYWTIDADNYDDETIRLLLEVEKVIVNNLGVDKEKASTTLVTKILLGVFGSVPAFDENFCTAFRLTKNLTKKALKKIATYYQNHRNELSTFDKSIRTLDFATGQETSRFYTKAKLIDMVGFVEGDKITRANRHRKKQPIIVR